MSEGLHFTTSGEGTTPDGAVTFRAGVPVLWLITGFVWLLVSLGPLVAGLVTGDYFLAILTLVILGPTAVFAWLILKRTMLSVTTVSVEDERFTFSPLIGAGQTVAITELREVRYEEYLFLHQLTFETRQWQSIVVKGRRKSAGFKALLSYVTHRPGIPYSGRKARTYKPHRELARGSMVPFQTYLEDETPTEMGSVAEIERWLADCEYAVDLTDIWWRPNQFEDLRKGDCEDHALWAWNKLHRLGIEAEMVLGDWVGNGKRRRRSNYHAWLWFRQDGVATHFETTNKSASAVKPWSEVQADYQPRYSVDIRNRTFRHRQ